MKLVKFISFILLALVFSLLFSNCTTRRVIIWNNDACTRYTAFRDSVAQLPPDKKVLNEERLEMLKASCAYSNAGLPINSEFNRFRATSY